MSKEGDQQNKKDGGAHKGTHVINTVSLNYFSEAFRINDSLNNLNENIRKSVKIQDGVSVADDNEITGDLPETFHFLSDEIDNYDRAVVENNTEWLKSRCKNLDSSVFDLNVSSVSDVSMPVSDGDVDSLPALSVPGLVSVQIAPNNIDQTNIETLTYDTDAVIPLASENLSGDTVFLLQDGSNQNVLQSVPNLSLDSAQNVSLDNALSVLSSCTDLGIDKETFLQVNKGLPSSDLPSTQQENVVLISQDSLLSQESGSIDDLGDSNMRLCVKDGVLSIVSTNQEKTDGTTPVANKYVAEAVDRTESVELMHEESQSPRVAQTAQDSRIIVINPIEANTKPQPSKLEERTSQPDFSLATISISNDKESNSTKILVDTSQGQRLYQLNVADFLNPKIQKMQTAASTVVAIPYQEVKLNNEEAGQASAGVENTSDTQGPQAQMQDYFLVGIPETDTESSQHNDPNAEILDEKGEKVKKLYICSEPGCGKVFKKSFKLSVHNMAHTGERPFKCSVAGCEWAFTTNYRLRRHEESHKGNKDHVCSVCGKHFSTIYNLNSHQRLHERPLNEVCTVEGCHEKFPTKRQLDMHMKNHEGLEKTYKCPHEGCNKTFYSAHCVGSHPRVHLHDQRELRCTFEGCGRVFDKQCRLTQHMRSHTGEKPYICNFEGCTWAFSTASKLTRHMTKHTGARKWVCIICGKGFRRGEHLKGHMITHSGMKPFSCPVEGCSAKFVAKSSLYVHMKKHDPKGEEQEILYHCPMDSCVMRFNCKASLRQHIIKHFPSKTPSEAANLDMVPLLNESLNEDELVPEAQVEGAGTSRVVAGSVEKGQPPVETLISLGVQQTEVEVPSGEITAAEAANPVAFICETDQQGNVNINIANDQSINGGTALPEDQPRVKDRTSLEDLTDPMTATIPTEFGMEKISFQPKITVRKNVSKGRGAARTDYQSNLELSDRARKRRKLLREKAEGSSINMEESSQDVPETQPEVPNVPEDFASETLSQGITFRDPETGVLYVQTQLLQDDPPHPDLYTEESMLKTELSLPVTTDSELTDHSLPGAEFVGSTINLQDLVG